MTNEKFASFNEAREAALDATAKRTRLNPMYNGCAMKVTSSEELYEREAEIYKVSADHKVIKIVNKSNLSDEKGFTTKLTLRDRNELKKAAEIAGWCIEEDKKGMQTFLKFKWNEGSWWRIEKKDYNDGLTHLYARNTISGTKKYLSILIMSLLMMDQAKITDVNYIKKGE